jgi:hypothetical protein
MNMVKDRMTVVVAIWLVIAGITWFMAFVGLLSPANAQGANARQACRADYEQFCSGVQRGGGRILACLKSHANELSPECQQALANTGGANR